MDESLSEWLRLRERADERARAAALVQAVAAVLPSDRPVRMLDLATGAGSNLRYLIERLPPRQQWTVVDRSPLLLDALIERTAAWAASRGHTVAIAGRGLAISGHQLDCRIETQPVDLAALDDPSLFAGRDLVTASALLDLVSATWLRALSAHCASAGSAALFTLTYDGRSSCTPREAEDEQVRELMNAHQLRDKGLGGPAEGPRATACAERCLTEAGFRVTLAQSDWVLDVDEAAMQRELIRGWWQAAVEMAPALEGGLTGWLSRRLTHIDAGHSRLTVGHYDLAALPGIGRGR